MEPTFVTYLLLILLIAAPVVYMYTLKLRQAFHVFSVLTVFVAGFFIVYVKQPLEAYEKVSTKYGLGIVENIIGIAIISLIFVFIGYESCKKNKLLKILPDPPRELNIQRLYLFGFVLIIIGAYAYNIQFSSAGGFWRWAAQARGGTDWENISGYVVQLANLLPLGVLFIAFGASLHRKNILMNTAAILLAIFVAMLFIYVGSRSRLIMWTMSLLYVLYSPAKRNPPLWVPGILFVLLIPITEFLAINRASIRDLNFYANEVNWDETKLALLPGFMKDPFEKSVTYNPNSGSDLICVAAVVSMYPKDIEYNLGTPLLELLTHGIPRAIWTEKRYPHYEAFTDVLWRSGLSSNWVTYGKTNILTGPAFTFIGHWYSMLGLVSIIIASLVTGYFYKLLDRWRYSEIGHQGRMILFLPVLSIGFSDAVATPLFWLFEMPIQLILMFIIIRLCNGSPKLKKIDSQ